MLLCTTCDREFYNDFFDLHMHLIERHSHMVDPYVSIIPQLDKKVLECCMDLPPVRCCRSGEKDKDRNRTHDVFNL